MGDARVFASFDVDHDADLRDLLVEHSRRGGSGFSVAERSEGGEPTDAWCASVRRRLRGVDVVVVICGEHTAASPRMNAELRLAQEEGKPHLLLWGRRERMCSMPAAASRSDSMYSWTWDILVKQVADTLRSAQVFEVPERYKRP